MQSGLIWAGTNNGVIQLTQDGGLTWRNVTPPDLNEHSNVVILEASHFDANVAFATVENRRDDTPYLYRTRDAGKTLGENHGGTAWRLDRATRFAKTPSAKACYTPRSPMASTFLSTMATTGNRSS